MEQRSYVNLLNVVPNQSPLSCLTGISNGAWCCNKAFLLMGDLFYLSDIMVK